MKKCLFLIFFLITHYFSYSQDSVPIFFPKRNIIFIDALGKSLFYSVGYERIFPLNEKVLLTANLGFSYITLGQGTNDLHLNLFEHDTRLQFENDASYFNIPLGGSVLIGKNGNYFELGFSEALWSIYSLSGEKRYFSHVPKGQDDNEVEFGEISDVAIYIHSQKHNHLELQTNLKIGYRHQNPNGGINYAISFQPFIGKSIVVYDLLSTKIQKDVDALYNKYATEKVTAYSSPNWQNSSFMLWIAFSVGYCF